MINQRICIVIACFLLNISSVVVANEATVQRNETARIFADIRNRIDLLNEIIQYPDSANMYNWSRLGNPNDESELSFYMNSISDGASTAYDKNAATNQKLIKHSQSTSKSEPSVLLQYLRLSLMAFTIRPGDSAPTIKINKIIPAFGKSNEYIVEAELIANNATGKLTPYHAKIIFEIADIEVAQKDLSIILQKMIVDGHVVYGWWYDLQTKAK